MSEPKEKMAESATGSLRCTEREYKIPRGDDACETLLDVKLGLQGLDKGPVAQVNLVSESRFCTIGKMVVRNSSGRGTVLLAAYSEHQSMTEKDAR
jgi:hypothetical protein